MSSIHSNSIGDVSLEDFQSHENINQKVLDCLLNIPLKPENSQIIQSHMTNIQKNSSTEQARLRKKIILFINCLLKDVKYRTQIKTLSINLSQIDKMKSANKLSSYQKDIVKFSILLKHNDVPQTKKILAKLISKVLVGDQTQEQE